ncbi:hypothetical protein TMatcc_005982 [Talaromyces marneffei ATCC 18224]|nr:hypothetical protein EYB25_003020 [Talaromyces marneffei]
MVNWRDPEAYFRLLAAIYAGNPGIKVRLQHVFTTIFHKTRPKTTTTNTIKFTFQIDIPNTALAYGCGATDRSIHNQICKCRELAKQLKNEVEKTGVQRPPRGMDGNAGMVSRTPRTPRTQFGGVSKSGGASSRSRGGAAKGKNLATPTKASKGSFTSEGMSMIDAIVVDSNDEVSVISLTKSETTSIHDDMKKEEIKKEFKREIDLTTPELVPSLQFFGGRPQPARVDSQTNGYVIGSGAQSATNTKDDFRVDDIFD